MSLDPEVFQSIAAPVKSFRIFALEQIIREGSTREVLDLLLHAKTNETDEECLLFFSHAIESVQSRLDSCNPTVKGEFSEQEFHERFVSAASGVRVSMLKNLPSREIASLAARSHGWLSLDTNPAVVSTIVRLFGKLWAKEAFATLKSLLVSPYLSVRFSALEVMVAQYPELLARDLPKFLASKEPRIRALAIQGLAKIDLDVAIEHLEAMLLGNDEHEKMCGLQNCLYLPFERIKQSLLRFLILESSHPLLMKAGLLLELNPDPDIPFRLLEIIQCAPLLKVDFFKKLYQGACRAVENSGLLGKDYPVFLEELKKFEAKLRNLDSVQEILHQTIALEAEGKLDEDVSGLETLDQPEIKNVLKQSLEWNLPATLNAKVRSLVHESPDSTEIVGRSQPSNRFSLDGVELAEAMRNMASWRASDKELVKPILQRILENKDSTVELRTAAIRTAKKCEIGDFVHLAEPSLKHVQEKLSVAALEYVARFDPDRAFPFLGYYLQSSGLRSKTTAITILKKFDPPQALSRISVLLGGSNPLQQKMAIFCMIQFEFNLVRDVLSAYLLTCSNPELLDLGLNLFKTNPDPESLYSLFKLEQRLPRDSAAKVRTATDKVVASLMEMQLLTPEKLSRLEKTFADRLNAEKQREKSAPAAYSLQEIRRRSATSETLLSRLGECVQSLLEQLLSHGMGRMALALGVCGIAVAGFLFTREGPDGGKPPRAGGLLAVSSTVNAKIVDLDKESGGLLIQAENGKKVVLLPGEDGFKNCVPGDIIKATFVPFRVGRSGILVAQSQKIEKVVSAEAGAPR